MLTGWEAIGVAAALGLLVGAERERSGHRAAGIRTFTLASVLGCVATFVPWWIGVPLVAVIGVLVVVGYAVTRERDAGMTTEVALMLSVGLGALAHSEPALAVAIAVGMTALLISKERLHRFIRTTVTDLERTDALKFLVAAFIVLPLLPDRPIGPYGVLNPRGLWLLVVLITGIGWLGYAGTRLLGPARGLLVAGLAGGFVSGIATTGAMGSRSRHPGRAGAALAGALMASVSTLLLVTILLFVVAPSLAVSLVPGTALGALALTAEAWWLERRERTAPNDGAGQAAAAVVEGRPFELLPALVLSAVLTTVLLATNWLTDLLGSAGAVLVASVGGLADSHGTSVAIATLANHGSISETVAVASIAAALGTNTLVKLVAALTGGPWFAARVAVWLAPAVVAVTLAALI